MRRYSGSLFVLLSTLLLLSSCLNSDEEDVTLYSDTALSSFYISTAKIYQSDSVYTTNSSMSAYPFYIDQLNCTVYNPDSMPYRTDVTKLLCSYSTKNNGLAYIKSLTSDTLTYLQTTDSIDFSSPRQIHVYASDLSSHRVYTVTVNVHQEKADSFSWRSVATSDVVAQLKGMKALCTKGKIVLFGSDGNTTRLFSTDESDGVTWSEAAGVSFGAEAYKDAVLKNGQIFVLDNGTLKASADGGASFTDVTTGSGLQRLVGASTTEMYGLSGDGQIMVSTDNGLTWSYDNAESEELSMLPATDISLCTTSYGDADSTDYVLMTGNRAVTDANSEATAMAWCKVVEYANGSAKNNWANIAFDDTNYYPLPRLKGLSVFGYDDKIMAIGGAGIGGCAYDAFANVYESRDKGLTWKANAAYALPDDFDKSAEAFAVTVDSDSDIWLICGGSGQVWRGKLNSAGWKRK